VWRGFPQDHAQKGLLLSAADISIRVEMIALHLLFTSSDPAIPVMTMWKQS